MNQRLFLRQICRLFREACCSARSGKAQLVRGVERLESRAVLSAIGMLGGAYDRAPSPRETALDFFSATNGGSRREGPAFQTGGIAPPPPDGGLWDDPRAPEFTPRREPVSFDAPFRSEAPLILGMGSDVNFGWRDPEYPAPQPLELILVVANVSTTNDRPSSAAGGAPSISRSSEGLQILAAASLPQLLAAGARAETTALNVLLADPAGDSTTSSTELPLISQRTSGLTTALDSSLNKPDETASKTQAHPALANEQGHDPQMIVRQRLASSDDEGGGPGGLIELGSSQSLLRQKRRTSRGNPADQNAIVDAVFDRYADPRALRSFEMTKWDLARLWEHAAESSRAESQYADHGRDPASDANNDGLIELLAGDLVLTINQGRPSRPDADHEPLTGSGGRTKLAASVGLYQAFELASTQDEAPVESGASQNPNPEPAEPASEHLTLTD